VPKYSNPNGPFTQEEWKDPQLAVKHYGIEHALYLYSIVEPRYRDQGLPDMPKDWEWRRLLVKTREKGNAKGVGMEARKFNHKIHRGNGGDHAHAPENLELLCRSCHRKNIQKRTRRTTDLIIEIVKHPQTSAECEITF
jgi:hypothetical protein